MRKEANLKHSLLRVEESPVVNGTKSVLLKARFFVLLNHVQGLTTLLKSRRKTSSKILTVINTLRIKLCLWLIEIF